MRVFGSVVCPVIQRSAYCWKVVCAALGSMYCPRDMSAAVSASHSSARRFCRSGKDWLFSVPSGPTYRAR